MSFIFSAFLGLQLLAAPQKNTPDKPQLELQNGDLLFGTLASISADQRLTWSNPSFPEPMSTPLSMVKQLQLSPDPVAPGTIALPLIRLRDGQTLRGQLLSMDAASLSIKIPDQEQPLSVPVTKLAGASFQFGITEDEPLCPSPNTKQLLAKHWISTSWLPDEQGILVPEDGATLSTRAPVPNRFHLRLAFNSVGQYSQFQSNIYALPPKSVPKKIKGNNETDAIAGIGEPIFTLNWMQGQIYLNSGDGEELAQVNCPLKNGSCDFYVDLGAHMAYLVTPAGSCRITLPEHITNSSLLRISMRHDLRDSPITFSECSVKPWPGHIPQENGLSSMARVFTVHGLLTGTIQSTSDSSLNLSSSLGEFKIPFKDIRLVSLPVLATPDKAPAAQWTVHTADGLRLEADSLSCLDGTTLILAHEALGPYPVAINRITRITRLSSELK